MSTSSPIPTRAAGVDDVIPLDIRRRSHRERFLGVAPLLYRADPNFVAPLRVEQRRLFDTSRNPWFAHSEMAIFVSERGRKTSGRIAAIVDRRHDEHRGESAGFFGFFESIDDPHCAAALLGHAEHWVGERGARFIRGPVSPSMHDECGVLVQGFDSPPVVMMPYNPAHYPALIEACGYCKERDLIAYEFITNQAMRPAIVRISETIEASGAFRVREIETKRFQREVETVRRIYNSAWDDNWGFVPLEDDEFRWRAASLKSILDPRLACFVEARGDDSWNAVGFVLAIPDVNEILIHLRGRLTPLAIARLVFGLRRVKTARVIMLGVVREYRKRGLESLLLREVHQRAARAGIRRGELSWVLEDNHATNRTIVKAGGRAYKVYRIYRKSIV